jgi:hypothetical protein
MMLERISLPKFSNVYKNSLKEKFRILELRTGLQWSYLRKDDDKRFLTFIKNCYIMFQSGYKSEVELKDENY